MSFRYSLFFVLMTALVIIISSFMLLQNQKEQERENNEELLASSAETVSESINSIIKMVHNNSLSIISDSDIQKLLQNNNVKKTEANSIIRKETGIWATSLPFISSVYVFRIGGGMYGMDKKYYKNSLLSDITMASWYPKVRELDGYFTIENDADYFMRRENDSENVSFLRIINGLDSYEPVGVLMVNIPKTAISETYSSLRDNTDISFYLLSEDYEIVGGDGDFPVEILKHHCDDVKKKIDVGELSYGQNQIFAGSIFNNENEEYLLASAYIKEARWHVLALIPPNNEELITTSYFQLLAIVLLATVLMFLICSAFVVFEISRPIETMVNIMNSSDGKLKKMEMRLPAGELTLMKNKYNEMVDRNEILIEQIRGAQKLKRKAELRILQEQIKPHFLYNTINAMEYLCITRQNDELYDALEAFGKFYQLSLSKGNEYVTIGDEISIVNNYMLLQKLRYGSEVDCKVEADPKLNDIMIPKLILQPLVENSLYHGIKKKMAPGLIKVRVFAEGNYISMVVEDDGAGISPQELKLLEADNLTDNQASFGLRGTIERLRAYFDNDIVYTIESEVSKGTRVTIKIPNHKGEAVDEEI